MQWPWAGLTLLTRGVPRSWSYLTAYGSPTYIHLNGTTYPMVQPWFDHPPLWPVLSGGSSLLLGARDIAAVTPLVSRPLPIALSVVAILLAYLLVSRVVGWEAALLTAVLLATSPTAVLLNREVEPEILMAVLTLAALLLAWSIVVDARAGWRPWGLLACCLALPLAKVPGLAIAGAVAVILLVEGRFRLAAAAAAAGAAGFGAFALFGALYDWHLWGRVLLEWGTRRRDVMGGFEFIAAAAGANRSMRDGWWLLGWIGLGAMLTLTTRDRRALWVAWPAIAYAAAIGFLGDSQVLPRYGWYRETVLPLAYAGAGLVGWQALRGSVPALLVFLTLGGATAADLVFGSPWVPAPWLVAALVGLPLLALAVSRRAPRLAAWAALALIALVVMANTVEAFNLARIYASL